VSGSNPLGRALLALAHARQSSFEIRSDFSVTFTADPLALRKSSVLLKGGAAIIFWASVGPSPGMFSRAACDVRLLSQSPATQRRFNAFEKPKARSNPTSKFCFALILRRFELTHQFKSFVTLVDLVHR